MTEPTAKTVTHHIVWRIEDNCPVARLVCDGNETSPCHFDPKQNPLSECWMKGWFDSSDPMVEYYEGADDVPLRSGPVDVWWDNGDECLCWRYIETAIDEPLGWGYHDCIARAVHQSAGKTPREAADAVLGELERQGYVVASKYGAGVPA